MQIFTWFTNLFKNHRTHLWTVAFSRTIKLNVYDFLSSRSEVMRKLNDFRGLKVPVSGRLCVLTSQRTPAWTRFISHTLCKKSNLNEAQTENGKLLFLSTATGLFSGQKRGVGQILYGLLVTEGLFFLWAESKANTFTVIWTFCETVASLPHAESGTGLAGYSA